jgi:mevalonate kinase
MNATGAAFGKLILLGEHAVVYGAPALVAGIDRGVRAVAAIGGRGRTLSLLGAPQVDVGADEPLGRAFSALLEAGGAPENLAIRIEGDLPAGVGLGFSAAAAVAIARAVEALREDEGEAGREGRVHDRAMAWERVFHGNPSGVDVAAAMHGGCLRFSRQEGSRPLEVGAPLRLCVGLSGTTGSTHAMVAGVASLREKNRDLVDRSVDALASCVDSAIAAIAAGQAQALGELMNLGQMLLAGLMVSTEELETLCATAREAGALGAKLTGAGGGGAVVALAGSGRGAEAVGEAIVAAWGEQGYQGFQTLLEPSP